MSGQIARLLGLITRGLHRRTDCIPRPSCAPSHDQLSVLHRRSSSVGVGLRRPLFSTSANGKSQHSDEARTSVRLSRRARFAPRSLDYGCKLSRSVSELVCCGCQPNASRVCPLEEGWSIAKTAPNAPKCSCGKLSIERFSIRPMTVATLIIGSPSSATACHTLPAGADTSANWNKTAASSAWTARQR